MPNVLSRISLDLLALRNSCVLIVFIRYSPTNDLLLILLKCWLHLETFLKIEEGCVFEATVADKVIKLMSCLNYIKVQYVVESNNIFLLQNPNVAINIKIL